MTSEHPKISWGPALTRNVKTIWLVETGFAKTRQSKVTLFPARRFVQRQIAARKDRDYMGAAGWFSAIFSGSCQSFGVSLRQILDFILKKAHAKGELPENSVA